MRVWVRTTWTTCSRRSSFRHLLSWMMLEMAAAAAERDLGSAFLRSARTGRFLDSRRAASSGSEGGLTCLAMGSRRWAVPPRLRLDLPMVVGLLVRRGGTVLVVFEHEGGWIPRTGRFGQSLRGGRGIAEMVKLVCL